MTPVSSCCGMLNPRQTVRLLTSLLLATTALAAARHGLAADGTTGATLELVATYHAVGVTLSFGDDDNADNHASFEYRLDGGAWRPGMALVRADVPNSSQHAWRGSIYPLHSGTQVEVRATLSDPDDAADLTLEDGTTVQVFGADTPGTTYYVTPHGSDSASGQTDQDPWLTLSHAIAQATCGDLVRVAAGTYAEHLEFDDTLACTADAPLVLRAAGAERPVVDSGIRLPAGSGGWSVHTGDIYVRDVAVPEDKYVRVLALDGKRAMRYQQLADLEGDATGLEVGRCYVQERIDASTRRLYVRTGHGDSPDEHDIIFAQNAGDETRDWRDNVALFFNGSSHVVIDGFVVRYSGGRGAVFTGDSHHNMLLNCLLYHNNVDVAFRSGTYNALWNSEVHELGTGDFPWGAFYSGDVMESQDGYNPIQMRGDVGQSIVGNDIHDAFDLISAGFSAEQFERAETDIFYNRLYNSADDAVELDGSGINLRVHGNQFRHAFVAFSLAPTRTGPTFVTRNTVTYTRTGFKLNNCMGVDQDGHFLVAHNSLFHLATCAGTGITSAPWECDGTPYLFANKTFRNNALASGPSCLSGRPEMDLDYDAFDPPEGEDDCFRWSPAPDQTERYTIDELRSAVGLEQHGLTADEQGVADLGWADTDGYRSMGCPVGKEDHEFYRVTDYPIHAAPFGAEDFTPLEQSVLLDRGEVLAGINDGFVGDGPDIGAVELGGEAPMACAAEGMTRPCGLGACAGTQTCTGGIWTACEGPPPTEEICSNGVDDDCDGEIDEGQCSPDANAMDEDGGCGCGLPGRDRTRLGWLGAWVVGLGARFARRRRRLRLRLGDRRRYGCDSRRLAVPAASTASP